MTSASPRHSFNLESRVPEEASGQKKWESVLFSSHLLYFKFLVIFGQKLTTNSSRLVASLLVCGIELRSGDSTSHLRGLQAGLIVSASPEHTSSRSSIPQRPPRTLNMFLNFNIVYFEMCMSVVQLRVHFFTSRLTSG